MQGDLFDNGIGAQIGEWWRDRPAYKLKEAAAENAETQKELNDKLIAQLSQKKAMSSGDTTTDNKKYYILGGVAFIMVLVLIISK